MPQSKVSEVKSRMRDILFSNKLEKQIHPVSWLVRKFWPIPGWTDEELKKLEENN